MSQLALFDDERQERTDTTHLLMPSMGFACGRDMLTDRGRFQVGITDWATITCPDCAALDPDDLRDEMRRQQGRQA